MRFILLTFLTISCYSMISAQSTGDIKVTYEKKDVSLMEMFSDLEAQYGVRFSYATSSIEDKVMDINFKDESIFNVLDYLMEDEPIEYKIVSNNILLKKANNYKESETDGYKSSIHLRGKITNGHDPDQSLEYATISVANTSIGTYSDEHGRFDIEIPEEHLNQDIIIHYLGYVDEVYKISELEDDFLLVSLNSSTFSIDEVMIVNREKPLKVGGSYNGLELNKSLIASKTSGLMGSDIGRQIQLLPGVSAHDDDSADIKIRGSNSDETLMILDGMPIYNASHYYGIFSNINTSYIDSVNIFKNTYPIQYGGKTAGLVELFGNDDLPTKTTGNIDLNMLTASGTVRVPLTDRSHFTVAGRSTLGAIDNNNFNTVKTNRESSTIIESFSNSIANQRFDPSFTFYDINANYTYQGRNGNSFEFNFFKSADMADNSYNNNRKNRKDNELNLSASDNESWYNTALSVLLTRSITRHLTLKTTAYYTNHENDDLNQFSLTKRTKDGEVISMDIPELANLESSQNNEITDISIDNHLIYNLDNQILKLGVTATHHDVNYRFRENQIEKLVGSDSFFELTGYAGHTINLFDNLNLTSGLRATYFTNLKTTALSPRFLLNYAVSDRLSFKSSYSIENQVIRQFLYEYRGEPMEIWVAAGQNDIPVLNSQNFMVGTTIKLLPFVLDIELYQKNIDGALEYLIPNAAEGSNSSDQSRDYDLFQGNGITRGMDIILSSGYKNYDTYLSYTLSRSEQQFDEIFNNKFFATENDRTHQLKWVNSLTTGRFTWGMNAIYVSGRPYTDIRNIGPNENIKDIDPDNRFRRVPAYHRLDLSTQYAFKIKKLNASLSASVFNLLNNENVKYIQSISTDISENNNTFNTIIGNESELLNRTFNLGLRVDF